MVTKADLRVGDADREAGAEALGEHYAQGRLTLEEFNERLHAAFTARTQGQLDEVTSDLPAMPSALPATATTDPARHDNSAHRLGMIGGLAAIVVIWLMVLVPTLTAFGLYSLPGRFPLLLIGLLVIRAVSRRLSGRGQWEDRSQDYSRYSGNDHDRRHEYRQGRGPGGRAW